MSIIETLAAAGVGVLCGGPGAEREVSLMSGERAHNALLAAGVPNRKIEVPAHGYTEFLEQLPLGLAVMMLHGVWGEDGGAQAILERRNIPFTGADSRASALAMDKNGSKIRFVEEGIPTPRWVVAGSADEAIEAARREELQLPFFVKPNYRGSSVGAGRVDRFDQLEQAARYSLKEDSLVIVEEMVIGREITIGWLDGKALPSIEMQAAGEFYDYEAKYLSDATRYQCPADLEPSVAKELSALAERVAASIGVRDSSRIDFILGDEGPMVLEINTIPGFTSHSLLPMAAAAAGMGVEQLTVHLATMAAKRAGLV